MRGASTPLTVASAMAVVMLAVIGLVSVTVPRFSPVHENPTWEGLAATSALASLESKYGETKAGSATAEVAPSAPVAVTTAKSPEQQIDETAAAASTADATQTAKAVTQRQTLDQAQVAGAHASLKAPKAASPSTNAAASTATTKTGTQKTAVEQATKLSNKVKTTLTQISHINVPGVSKHSDAQLDQMAEVYFRKLSDKKEHHKVMKIVKHQAIHREAKARDVKPALHQKSKMTVLAEKQKKSAEKKRDAELDKEAESLYQKYTARKTQLARASTKLAKVPKKSPSLSQSTSVKAKAAKAQDAAAKAKAKLAKQQAKLKAEQEDKTMDIEAEKLYHQYVEKKAEKLKAVKEQKLAAERRQKAVLAKKLQKAATAPSKVKSPGKSTADDATLDKEAEKDYQKFVSLKEKQAKKAEQKKTSSDTKMPNDKPAIKTSATKTEAKFEKKAKTLDDKKLDQTAEKDYKLFQRLKEHKAKLAAAKKKAQLEQQLSGSTAEHAKPDHSHPLTKAKPKGPVATDSEQETKARKLYKIFEREQQKAKAAKTELSKPEESDEEKYEKKLSVPDLKKLKPLKPTELKKLEVKRAHFEKKMTGKSADRPSVSTPTSRTGVAASKSGLADVSKPLNAKQLAHLVKVEHKLNAEAAKLGQQSTKTKPARQQTKPLSHDQLSKLEHIMPKAVVAAHKAVQPEHSVLKPKAAHKATEMQLHSEPKVSTKASLIAKATALKPLSRSELKELGLMHGAGHARAHTMKLAAQHLRAAQPSAPRVSEKQQILAKARREPMSAKELSELEQMTAKRLANSRAVAPSLRISHVMEKADQESLMHGSRYAHAEKQAPVKMANHKSLGIEKLVGAGKRDEEPSSTQKLEQVSLAEMPDDFIPKDSPAYQMVMQARMAAQQEHMQQQQALMSTAQAKDEYNDKMKRLDEKAMLDESDELQTTQLSEVWSDTLAGPDDEVPQEQMLMPFDSEDGSSDSFSEPVEDDGLDSGVIDSPQESYAGNHAIMLGGV